MSPGPKATRAGVLGWSAHTAQRIPGSGPDTWLPARASDTFLNVCEVLGNEVPAPALLGSQRLSLQSVTALSLDAALRVHVDPLPP